jgi:hypothetical protein
MARYSPELLAVLRTRYEDTDQPMNALAADFEIGITTLQTLVRKNGWTPRSQRLRDCPPSVRLLEESETLVATLPERESPKPEATPTHVATPTPTLSLAGGGSEAVPVAMPALAPTTSTLSPVERIEALILKELEAEEAVRAALGTRPRPRYDAERCARTLWVLTQTLERLQRLHPKSGSSKDGNDDPVPEDMDAFREELARRIKGFIKGRIGPERMALNQQMSALTDDEVKELIQVGRERGMRALLEPPLEKEDDPLHGHARA